MHRPSLSECAPKVLRREIFVGEDEYIVVEMSLIFGQNWTLVVLREAQTQHLRDFRPILGGAFEYVATILRHELVHLKGIADKLKFFHAQYDMAPTGCLKWKAQEVELLMRGDQYVFARWVPLNPLNQETVTATLNSWGPPQRTLL